MVTNVLDCNAKFQPSSNLGKKGGIMLEVGDIAPDFAVKDHNGRVVKLSDYRGKTLVLWFYPRASTGGWTAEGIGFQERIQDYRAKDVEILGASTDSIEANAKFASDQGFSYPLLCDTEREVCLAYGACKSSSDSSAKRITYVIDPDGKILQAHETVDVHKHPETLLDSL